MTSQINTNGINTNYPVPGTNNSSQGFRNNFSQIAAQLNTGANEITDLQSKAVLKAALNNSTLNNDMANALISNASTSGFRATTYNLGNALAGTVTVNVNQADVQYGAVQGNVILQFGNWAPTNTQSNVVLRLTFANTNPAYISLPANCINSNNDFGVTLLENYANVFGTATISAPATADILELRFSTIDCGNTVTVEPINRPYQATQVFTRDPAPPGLPGDVNGTISVGNSIGQVTATATSNNVVTITANTFTSTGSTISGTTLTIGTLTSGSISSGMLLTTGAAANTYIVSNQTGSGSGSTWTVSTSQSVSSTNINGSTGIVTYANNIPVLKVGSASGGTVQAGMILSGTGIIANTFIVQNISGSGNGSTWQVSSAQFEAPATITGNAQSVTVSSTNNFYQGMPITFTGAVFGNIQVATTYYVLYIDEQDNQITLSTALGGSMLALTNSSGVMYGNPVTYMYLATADYNSTAYAVAATNTYVTTNQITVSSTLNLSVNAPIIFTGNVFGGLNANTVYYITNIDSGNSNIAISQARYNGIAGPNVLLTTANGACTATCYTGGNDIWQRISFNAW
jgi:uncharacterized protein YdeI (BOF family)